MELTLSRHHRNDAELDKDDVTHIKELTRRGIGLKNHPGQTVLKVTAVVVTHNSSSTRHFQEIIPQENPLR
jgi:hypothetical protein